MIIVRLMGGIGNQMFQYACGRALAIRRKDILRLDHSFLHKDFTRAQITKRHFELDAFCIHARLSVLGMKALKLSSHLSRFVNHSDSLVTVQEADPYRANTLFPVARNLYISGYFQSERYFKDVADIIRKDFSFRAKRLHHTSLIEYVKSIKNSVGILIRRDDALTVDPASMLPASYFLASLQLARRKVNHPRFLVFTIGDTAWAKTIFRGEKDVQIIENESPNIKGFEKMQLLSLCNHDIIANSSFAWWSAWLNQNPEKIVIAPRRWHADRKVSDLIVQERLPAEWLKI